VSIDTGCEWVYGVSVSAATAAADIATAAAESTTAAADFTTAAAESTTPAADSTIPAAAGDRPDNCSAGTVPTNSTNTADKSTSTPNYSRFTNWQQHFTPSIFTTTACSGYANSIRLPIGYITACRACAS
jgi:hypothetical protein